MQGFDTVFDDFINLKSKFFDLPDGGEKVVTFISVEPITTNFKGKEIQCLRYVLEIEGKHFLWDRTSRELAKQMRQYVKGDILKIKRVGERNQTQYFIEKVNG